MKFEIEFEGEWIPDSLASELVSWAKKLDEDGLTPPYEYNGRKCNAGNLSYRKEPGFVITPTARSSASLSPLDLVFVVRCDPAGRKVFARGSNPPSSEALTHYAIYSARPDVGAVFHGHDGAILKNAGKMGEAVAKEAAYGSVELALGVQKSAEKADFIVLENHGFIALGKTMRDAGELALGKHDEAERLG